MLKNSLTIHLPEFNGDLVDDDLLTVFLDSVDTSLPEKEYKNEDKAKAYWVAMNYFDAQSRASDLDGSSSLKSEKIDDVATTFKDEVTTNPYSKLFYSNIVTEVEEPSFGIGFMVAK